LEPLAAPHILPYRRIASIRVNDGSSDRVATGWFFGDSLVITAAHVFDNLTDPLITLWPGRSDADDAFFGVWTTRRFRIAKEGLCAGIFVPQPVGLSVGTFGIANIDQSVDDRLIEVAGYEALDNGQRPVHGIGPIISASHSTIKYDVITMPGQSGAPVWLDGDPDFLVGVHQTDGEGTRFSEALVLELLAWRST